jgi:hypothetical protein
MRRGVAPYRSGEAGRRGVIGLSEITYTPKLDHRTR